MLEELVYDEDGQLLTTSFMDYLIPTATDMPSFDVCHIQTAAPQIPGGYKGMGEGGCVYAYAAVAQRRRRRHRAAGSGDHRDAAVAQPHSGAAAGAKG